MLFIINTSGYNEFGKFYPNYYFDERTNTYYDEYLNLISKDRYPIFNIKVKKEDIKKEEIENNQLGGATKHSLTQAEMDKFEDYTGEIGKNKLFTMVQATNWTIIRTMLLNIAIPKFGVNPITNIEFDVKKEKKEKPKPDAGDDVKKDDQPKPDAGDDVKKDDQPKPDAGDDVKKGKEKKPKPPPSVVDILKDILFDTEYIIKFEDPDVEQQYKVEPAYYSFARMDKAILTKLITEIVGSTTSNNIRKAQVAEKKAANCINFFCIKTAHFDTAPKQRQECDPCTDRRNDIDQTQTGPVEGFQFDFEVEKRGNVEVTYIKAIPREVIVCYTSMCYNNFNPSYWKMKDGSNLLKKVNGKDIFENKIKDKDGNDNQKIYKFIYQKPIFKWRRVTGLLPNLKEIPLLDDDGKQKKNNDGKLLTETIYERNAAGIIQFYDPKLKNEKTPFKRFLYERIDGAEVIINNKPYTCELKLSHKTYGKGIIELDHKDGNHHNNSIDNIQPLCRICHAIKTDLQQDKAGGTGENYILIKRYELFLGKEANKKTKSDFLNSIIFEKINNITKSYFKFKKNDKGEEFLVRDYKKVLSKYNLYNYPKEDDDVVKKEFILAESEANITMILEKHNEMMKENALKLKTMEKEDILINDMAEYEIKDSDPNQKKAVVSVQQAIMNNNQNDEEKGLIEVTLEGMAELEDLKKNYNVNITDVISIASTKIKTDKAEEDAKRAVAAAAALAAAQAEWKIKRAENDKMDSRNNRIMRTRLVDKEDVEKGSTTREMLLERWRSELKIDDNIPNPTSSEKNKKKLIKEILDATHKEVILPKPYPDLPAYPE